MKGVGSIFSSLLCLAVPVGIALLLMKIIIGHGKNPANPFVVPPVPEPPPSSPASPIRKTGDGFWIQGPWPMGSNLRLRYIIAGALTEMDLIYRPGPDGQFVFTGTEPDSVSVVSDDGSESSLPPPYMPDPTPVFRDENRDEPRPSRPPRFPSAY